MKEDLLTSIVMPARNEAIGLGKLLPRLKSLFPDAEILVINDGSTDSTLEVCKQYSGSVQGTRCKSHLTPHNIGNGAAININ